MPSNDKVAMRALMKIIKDNECPHSTRLGAIVRYFQLKGRLNQLGEDPKPRSKAPVPPVPISPVDALPDVDFSDLLKEVETSDDEQTQ